MADSSAAPRPARSASDATPFMAQYLAAKAQHPDALLFFRMGDFYEMFFEDAEKAAAALGIALTKRGQHQGEDIPMAGVPWRQADAYLLKLIRAGFRVAVCEQTEDPAEARKRGSKAIVRREITRLVTPGTLTEEGLLDARAANRLAAFILAGETCALAWTDVSTGDLDVRAFAAAQLGEELSSLAPAELLTTERDAEFARRANVASGAPLTVRANIKADPRGGERRLKALLEVETLDAFGAFASAELGALGLLIDYVEQTQAGLAPRLSPPQRNEIHAFLAIDPATRTALEIDRSVRGAREGSLLDAIDRTVTAAGARLLAKRVARPLTDRAQIARRHDGVAFFLAEPERRADLRKDLRAAGDLARALTRLVLKRGGPRDLAALRNGLRAGEQAAARCTVADAPAELAEACEALSSARQIELAALARDLARALADDLPLLVRDGGFIAAGFDSALDELRRLRDDSRGIIAALQRTYAEETGIAALKLKHNAVLGYHVDVSQKQAEQLMRPPLAARFIHRQTNANSVRFTTTELAELDAKIARAGEAALARELALFQEFVSRAAEQERAIRNAGEALGVLDVAAAFAEWADETGAVRPEIDDSAALIAEAARHPVVESALRSEGKGFTANDSRLDGEGQAGARLLLVTGPNMAGKSTYLRQTALLAILAQAGSFVPAKRLRLGIVDRLFARVGASDDLARGRSTFMTEMIETAAILHQAGPQSLVVLDEIGRGTATFDGLALAWAAAEHLHEANRCRAVFATHYHELTVLPGRLRACANAHLRAREWKGDLIFLHEVASGAADRSYGVQVAKLAGVPRSVLERAKAVLARLEASRGGRVESSEDLPLFAGATGPSPKVSAVERALEETDPNALTPLAALELVYRLKSLLDDAAD